MVESAKQNAAQPLFGKPAAKWAFKLDELFARARRPDESDLAVAKRLLSWLKEDGLAARGWTEDYPHQVYRNNLPPSGAFISAIHDLHARRVANVKTEADYHRIKVPFATEDDKRRALSIPPEKRAEILLHYYEEYKEGRKE